MQDERRSRLQPIDYDQMRIRVRQLASPHQLSVPQLKHLNNDITRASNVDELLHVALAHSRHLNHIHVANLWHKLGKQPGAFKARHQEKIQRVLQCTEDAVEGCGARELAGIALGLAKSRLQRREACALFEAVADKAVQSRLSGFNPQDLANTVWAFATAGEPATPLFEVVANDAVQRELSGFNQVDLAQIAYAFHVMTDVTTAKITLTGVASAAAVLDWQPFESTLANLAFTLIKAGLFSNSLFSAISLCQADNGDTGWSWFASSGSPLIVAIAAAIRCENVDDACMVIDPPLPFLPEDLDDEDVAPSVVIDRRSQRVVPAYRCIESYSTGKHGESHCPNVCTLFYRIQGGLYCTWCMQRGGRERLAEATPMTLKAYSKALELTLQSLPAAVTLAAPDQQRAVLVDSPLLTNTVAAASVWRSARKRKATNSYQPGQVPSDGLQA